MDTPVLDVTADEAADLLRDPYPIFERRRRETSGVFCGSVMDWTKAAEDFRPENLYAAVSFDATTLLRRRRTVWDSNSPGRSQPTEIVEVGGGSRPLFCSTHEGSSRNRTPQLAAMGRLVVFWSDWLGDWDSNRQAAGCRQRFYELVATLSDWT